MGVDPEGEYLAAPKIIPDVAAGFVCSDSIYPSPRPGI